MRFATLTTIFVVCGLTFPSFASAEEVVTLVPHSDGVLLRSGFAAIQRLSEEERRVVASNGDSPGLLRSGIAAVERMSEVERMSDVSRRDFALAAQAQQTHLNHPNKRTVIILVAVAAVAAVIWIRHELGKGFDWTGTSGIL